MKLKIFILFLLVQFSVFSQKDSIIVKGLVTNSEAQKRVKNALVHLISSQGHRYEYKTDSTGLYRFHFYSESAFTCTVTIASDKWTTSGKFHNIGFLASKDNAVFELAPGKTYEKNFELKEIIACEPFIHLLFYTGSSISCNDSLNKTDSLNYERLDNSITHLSHILKDNPTMVIELQGHASTADKNPDGIALERVQKIKELLVAHGIKEKRIQTKSWGTQKPLVKNDIIKRAKTKEEKMSLHLNNQRVVFRIVSWDFVEEKK